MTANALVTGGMIAKRDMMPLLLAACPSFEPKWHQFAAEWHDEHELPLTIALNEFAAHLRGMLDRGEAGAFPEIFRAIENLHVEGDASVKEYATIGILESLQNDTHPERFRPYLGRETERWWDKLNRFWDGEWTALQD